MKLLFDANLSPHLVHSLNDVYPNSAHVLFVGLGPAPTDEIIWAFAATHDFAIVTKDSDFSRLSLHFGAPPKAIWLRIGNTSSTIVERTLRSARADISAFSIDPAAALLVIGRRS